MFDIDDSKGKRFAALTSAPDAALLHQLYKAHTKTLIRAIEEQFPGISLLRCAEFGGGPGTLVKDVKELLQRPTRITNIDCSQELLDLDTYSDQKICQSLEQYQTRERFDVGLMRYVLQYNSLDGQRRILQSVRRNVHEEGIFVMQQCGPVNAEHQRRVNRMFDEIPRLQRPGAYWSNWDEVEQMLRDARFKPELKERFRSPIIELFQARYNLSPGERTRLQKTLQEYDWLEYTISASR